MRIPRYQRQSLDNGIVVVGREGRLTKPLPSVGAALSYAQALATLVGGEYIVRWYEDDMYRVERDEHGVVNTRAA